MKTDLLENTLDVLYLVKQELSNNAEDCVIQELDKAIELLEVEKTTKSNLSTSELLRLLDLGLSRLPSIISLIDKLSG